MSVRRTSPAAVRKGDVTSAVDCEGVACVCVCVSSVFVSRSRQLSLTDHSLITLSDTVWVVDRLW